MREYLMCTTFRAERTNASLCRQCGKCEQHCPQGIAVRKELKQVVRHMENPVYKVIAFLPKTCLKIKLFCDFMHCPNSRINFSFGVKT